MAICAQANASRLFIAHAGGGGVAKLSTGHADKRDGGDMAVNGESILLIDCRFRVKNRQTRIFPQADAEGNVVFGNFARYR